MRSSFPSARSYLLSKTIGEGTFGKVKLGVHLLTGERVAVKVLEKDRITDKGDVKRVTREIQILKHIHHPHVVNLLEVIEKPRTKSARGLLHIFWLLRRAPSHAFFLVEALRARESVSIRAPAPPRP